LRRLQTPRPGGSEAVTAGARTSLNAAYFVIAEALANVEKHSQATHAAVEVRSLGAALPVINVTDNGVGGAPLTVPTGWPGWPTGCAAWMAP
jgi:signal transduction histidine kinase